MPLAQVEKYQYGQMVQDTLNKILITSKKAFAFVVRALQVIVLKRPARSGKPIPKGIEEKAKQLRALIDERDMWVPIDEEKAHDRRYLNRRQNEQNEFANIVKRMVTERVRDLRFMSIQDRRALVQQHKAKWEQLKKPKPNMMSVRAHVPSVESDEYVFIREQWRLNLTRPFSDSSVDSDGLGSYGSDDEEGVILPQNAPLNDDEMSKVASLVDTERYPWGYAQLLTSNLKLAHWLVSPSIYPLIQEGLLDVQKPRHLEILVEPQVSEQKRLENFSWLIQHNLVSVDNALSLELTDFDYEVLEDEDFKIRARTLDFTEEDFQNLWQMGISTDTVEEKRQALLGRNRMTL